jgi:cellulose/xylan binding protein with CBM9 domain
MIARTHAAAVAATLAVLVCGAAPKELPTKKLELHRTDTAPVLDGKRDDACWKQAAATGDFELFKGKGAPKNRTRAWVTYDAENLYLFFECYDRTMNKVAGRRPQDKIDEDIWQEEEIELFFDVNHDRKTYYQLMCSVLGTKCDMASVLGQAWHGGRDRPGQGWKAKTRRDGTAWYAEVAIPFTAMRRTTELAATPQPGQVWGANFYRHEYHENEWINWNVATRGFHQPTHFGELHFISWRNRTGSSSASGTRRTRRSPSRRH